ncbi:MAG: L,D-transpeptidase [Rhodobacteraceae bacterium]|nr:L,D-transpeptidase [Paracoccaceae bacterium]
MRAAAVTFGLLVAAPPAGSDDLSVRVDVPVRRMGAVRRGVPLHADRAVATAGSGRLTPTGTFRPERLERFRRSSLHGGAPTPWSIFFSGNHAIHGMAAVDRPGSPAEAGRIRREPENAGRLGALVQAPGPGRSGIVIEA